MPHPVRLRRCALTTLLAAGMTAAGGAHARAFNARISQPVIEQAVGRGQTASGAIDLDNLSNEPVTVQVYLQDWEYVDGGSGDKLFSAPGLSPWSASNWISFFPQKLTLPPLGKGKVEYTIRVPDDAPAGGRYAVLFFESILGQPTPNAQGVMVQYTGRLGSLIEVQVAGTVERAGQVDEVTVGAFREDRPLALTYRFRNQGNVAIRPKAYFNIVDGTGRYFGRGEFPQLYTFPGRSGTASTEWNGTLAPGRYTVLITVDLGDQQTVVAERPLTVDAPP